MTTLAANLATTAPQPLLPALARFAIAAAVGIALTAVWVEAETQSHNAVDIDTSSMALSAPSVRHVNLPTVTVIGTRTAKAHAA
jgi:hypothetical protein